MSWDDHTAEGQVPAVVAAPPPPPQVSRRLVLALAASLLLGGGIAVLARDEEAPVRQVSPTRTPATASSPSFDVRDELEGPLNAEAFRLPLPGQTIADTFVNGRPVFLVRHQDGSLSALDPRSSTSDHVLDVLTQWCSAARSFVDPQDGTVFNERGGPTDAARADDPFDHLTRLTVVDVDADKGTALVSQREEDPFKPAPVGPVSRGSCDAASLVGHGLGATQSMLEPFDNLGAVRPGWYLTDGFVDVHVTRKGRMCPHLVSGACPNGSLDVDPRLYDLAFIEGAVYEARFFVSVSIDVQGYRSYEVSHVGKARTVSERGRATRRLFGYVQWLEVGSPLVAHFDEAQVLYGEDAEREAERTGRTVTQGPTSQVAELVVNDDLRTVAFSLRRTTCYSIEEQSAYEYQTRAEPCSTVLAQRPTARPPQGPASGDQAYWLLVAADGTALRLVEHVFL